MAKTPSRSDTRKGRFYTVDTEGGERRLPSVTTLLQALNKPALVGWSAKVEREAVVEASANLYEDLKRAKDLSRPAYIATLNSRIGKEKAYRKELDKACEIGTQAHALIEWNLRKKLGQKPGPEPRISDAASWAVMAWEDWAASVNLEPIWVEQTVFSLKHGYAGTADLIAKVDGRLALLDWKTSKGDTIYDEYHLQNAAYRVALEEMGHGHCEVGYVVKLPKTEQDTAFKVGECLPPEECFEVFLAIKKAWEFVNREAA